MTENTLLIYTRVSTEVQAEKGFSLDAQRKAGIQKAKQLGLKFEVFEERGKSAAKEDLENRPQLKKLLDLIETEKAKDVFVIEDSRLSRNLTTASLIANIFIKYKCVLYTPYDKTDYGNIDYQTKFRKSLNALLSTFENDQRVERSKRGKLEAVRKGKWGGGMSPFGYKVDNEDFLIVDSEESKWYKKMVELSLSGKGSGSIAEWLNEKGVKTKASKTYKKGMTIIDKHTKKEKFIDKNKFIWKPNTVLTILKNPVHKGERHFKNEIISVPSIIDSQTWRKVQDNLSKNKNTAERNNKKYFYLLRNLLVCNRCGKSLLGYIKPSRGMRVYYCSSKRRDPIPNFCGMKSINIDKLNDLIWENLMNVLTNSSVVRKSLKRIFSKTKIDKSKIEKDNKAILKKIEDTEVQRKNLIRLAAKGTISDKDLEQQLKDLDNEIYEFQNLISSNLQRIKLSENQEGTFEWIIKAEEKAKQIRNTKDLEKKKEIVNTFIDKIYVDYLEEEKEHVIEMKLKYKLFDGDKHTIDLLLDGTEITDDDDDSGTGIKFSTDELQELEFDGDYPDIKAKSPIVTQSQMRH
jgi:site-specific DNA recombinase